MDRKANGRDAKRAGYLGFAALLLLVAVPVSAVAVSALSKLTNPELDDFPAFIAAEGALLALAAVWLVAGAVRLVRLAARVPRRRR